MLLKAFNQSKTARASGEGHGKFDILKATGTAFTVESAAKLVHANLSR